MSARVWVKHRQTMGILGNRKLKRSQECNWQLERKTNSLRFVQLRLVFMLMGKWDDSKRVQRRLCGQWFCCPYSRHIVPNFQISAVQCTLSETEIDTKNVLTGALPRKPNLGSLGSRTYLTNKHFINWLKISLKIGMLGYDYLET